MEEKETTPLTSEEPKDRLKSLRRVAIAGMGASLGLGVVSCMTLAERSPKVTVTERDRETFDSAIEFGKQESNHIALLIHSLDEHTELIESAEKVLKERLHVYEIRELRDLNNFNPDEYEKVILGDGKTSELLMKKLESEGKSLSNVIKAMPEPMRIPITNPYKDMELPIKMDYKDSIPNPIFTPKNKRAKGSYRGR